MMLRDTRFAKGWWQLSPECEAILARAQREQVRIGKMILERRMAAARISARESPEDALERAVQRRMAKRYAFELGLGACCRRGAADGATTGSRCASTWRATSISRSRPSPTARRALCSRTIGIASSIRWS